MFLNILIFIIVAVFTIGAGWLTGEPCAPKNCG